MSRALDHDQLDDIALYLNFDMIGSPNAGYFTDDGDQSGQAGPVRPPCRTGPPVSSARSPAA